MARGIVAWTDMAHAWSVTRVRIDGCVPSHDPVGRARGSGGHQLRRPPAFTHDGRALVSIAAAKAHCPLYLQSDAVMRRFATELRAYPTGKGSVRFTPDAPLPGTLVRRIVKTRIAEVERAAATR